MRNLVVAATLGGLLAGLVPAAAAANQPPTAPRNLRVVDVTPFTAVLAWDASTDDRDGSQLSYTVYGTPEGEFGDRWGWTWESTSTTVERLTPGTRYTFTVRASDSWAQQSPHSNPVTVTTDAIDPLPVPTNVRATRNHTGSEVELAFDVADDPRVAFYNIKRDGQQVGFTLARDHTFTATRLDPETTYEFQVAAVLSNHFEGPLSQPARVTTARDSVAPTAPRRLAIIDRTGTSVDMRWQRGSDNVAVKEYVVSSGSTTQIVPVVRGSEIEYRFEFTGLAPETPFTFTVRARDAAGNLSPPSNAQMISTGVDPDTVPPAPVTGLDATLIEDIMLDITWNLTTDNVTLQPNLDYRVSFENGASIVLRNERSFFTADDGTGLFGCVVTVQAIDRAGNVSEPRSDRVC
jgi:chitodextrinase